jgi:hypothetical protein
VKTLQPFAGEPIPDTVPLTSWEQVRKEELEKVVEGGFEQFLRVGQALAELRSRRLYRTHYATFAEYVRARFGLARSSVDQLIRSQATAQALLDAGEELPPNTSQALMRPLSNLPTLELKSACWSLAKALAPEHGPTEPLISKLTRMVRNCLEDADGETNAEYSYSAPPGGHHRNRTPLQRETPFIRPVQRLASWSGFNAEVVISHIAEPSNAGNLYRACGRCCEIQERLLARFPELENSRCPAQHELNASDA